MYTVRFVVSNNKPIPFLWRNLIMKQWLLYCITKRQLMWFCNCDLPWTQKIQTGVPNSLKLYLQGIFHKQHSYQRTGVYLCTANYPAGENAQRGCLVPSQQADHMSTVGSGKTVHGGNHQSTSRKRFATEGFCASVYCKKKQLSTNDFVLALFLSLTFGYLMTCRSVLCVFVNPSPPQPLDTA